MVKWAGTWTIGRLDSLAWRRGCPVSFDSQQYHLPLEWTIFVVHYLRLPSHAISYALHFDKNIYIVSKDQCPLRPKNPIHLQQYVLHITPNKDEAW